MRVRNTTYGATAQGIHLRLCITSSFVASNYPLPLVSLALEEKQVKLEKSQKEGLPYLGSKSSWSI